MEKPKNLLYMTHGHELRRGGMLVGGSGGRIREKVQGIRSINGRYKIDRGKLRVVWDMDKPKNLYVQYMDMN